MATATLNEKFTSVEKVIYGTKEFGDLVIQVSNYGIDIVKPDANAVGGFKQVCFFTQAQPIAEFILSSLVNVNNITDTVMEKDLPEHTTTFTYDAKHNEHI